MKNLSKAILVLAALSSLSAIAPKTEAALFDLQDPCGNYAAKAVYQFRSQQLARCSFGGARWNENGAGQHNWCRTVRPLITEMETKARAQQIMKCLNPRGSINTGDLSLNVGTLNTQLQSAISRGATERAQQLIAAGADLKGQGIRLMETALDNNNMKTVAALRRFHIPLSSKKYNPLTSSVSYYYTYNQHNQKQMQKLQWLIQNGVNPNAVAINGHTALYEAISANNVTAVSTLLRLRANPNLDIKGGNCKTHMPLDKAIDQGNEKIINLLRRAGARTRTQCAG